MRQHAACATGNRGSRSRGVGVSQFQLSVVAMLNLNFMWLVGGGVGILRYFKNTPGNAGTRSWVVGSPWGSPHAPPTSFS